MLGEDDAEIESREEARLSRATERRLGTQMCLDYLEKRRTEWCGESDGRLVTESCDRQKATGRKRRKDGEEGIAKRKRREEEDDDDDDGDMALSKASSKPSRRPLGTQANERCKVNKVHAEQPKVRARTGPTATATATSTASPYWPSTDRLPV